MIDENRIERAAITKEEMRDSLLEALDLIKSWHGPVAWEIYRNQSPEMKRIIPAFGAIRVLLALIESAGVKHSGEQPAPLPKEVEEAMVTIHEAAYDGLCYKYHTKDKVEWWDAFLKAEALIKAALEKPAPPAEPCPGNLNCPACLALERADDGKEKK